MTFLNRRNAFGLSTASTSLIKAFKIPCTSGNGFIKHILNASCLASSPTRYRSMNFWANFATTLCSYIKNWKLKANASLPSKRKPESWEMGSVISSYISEITWCWHSLQLFGASNLINAKESVQEAKNSARLGETVKLLTLVTIFFLPLGYITVSQPQFHCSHPQLRAIVSLGYNSRTISQKICFRFGRYCIGYLSRRFSGGQMGKHHHGMVYNTEYLEKYTQGSKVGES